MTDYIQIHPNAFILPTASKVLTSNFLIATIVAHLTGYCGIDFTK